MTKLEKRALRVEAVGLVLPAVSLLAVSPDLPVLQVSPEEPHLPSRLVPGALLSVGVLGQVDFRPVIHKRYLSEQPSAFAHHS